MVGIWLVEKLSSEQVPPKQENYGPHINTLYAPMPLVSPSINTPCFQLLERLTSKGKRQPEFTRELIKNKLSDDEDGIATTNLKVCFEQPKLLLLV